jgi:transcriptional regulator with XRE-family HTH domain
LTPRQFKRWRKAMRLHQRQAADQLGLKKRVIQYYERGRRDGKKIEIPKTVELACYALTMGVDTYDGAVVKRAARKKKSAPAAGRKRTR